MAKKKAEKKEKEKKVRKKKGVWTLYEVQGDKLVRKAKWSPKAGPGFFMANHKNRTTCGKSGYTEFKQ